MKLDSEYPILSVQVTGGLELAFASAKHTWGQGKSSQEFISFGMIFVPSSIQH